MTIETLLARLPKARRSGKDCWRSACPGHDGSNPTALSIRECSDGRILMKCFHGCSIETILGSIGLELDDLFSDPIGHRVSTERRKFYPSEMLAALKLEAQIVTLAAFDLKKGKALTNVDHERLTVAMERINEAVELTQ